MTTGRYPHPKHEKIDEDVVKTELSASLQNYHALRVSAARRSIDEFIELVGLDERSGKPVVQSNTHLAFQRFATEHKKLVLWSHIESGKTNAFSVFRILWRLGRNPNLRIAIVSNTAGQAKKPLRAIQQYIEKAMRGDSVLAEIFPNLKPGRTWSEFALSVERTDGTPSKDYSVQAVGVHGNVLGARFDEVILDDILDYENTRTPHARDELHEWYNATIAGRLTANSAVRFIGTAWHPDDIMHRMAATPGFFSVSFPVLTEDGQSSWPERWPLARIEEARAVMGTREFSRQLMCVARDEEGSRFATEWIRRALELGDGRSMPGYLNFVPPGYATYTGVDLATGKKKGSKNHKTVLFTVAVHPDESREVLCVEGGNWTGPEILQRIVDTHRRYQSIIFVEDNAAQEFIVQFTKNSTAVPVKPFNTGKNKYDPSFGVESLAVELENGKWIIPSSEGRPLTQDVQEWIDGMLNYVPGTHTSDYLMASWIAREGIRLSAKRSRSKAQTGQVSFLLNR